ncbi:hypothetical protein DB345_03845 [Spartobacteria bacterium LR76]|nr:hypothetical protein DB345_03845 [Spartobacteria bacterium LR76]
MGSAGGVVVSLWSVGVLLMVASLGTGGVSSIFAVLPGWLAWAAGLGCDCRDKSIRWRTCALRERWDARAAWLKA